MGPYSRHHVDCLIKESLTEKLEVRCGKGCSVLIWEFPKVGVPLKRILKGFLKGICKGSIKGLGFRVSEN